jgi:hypothetical protein
MPYAVRHSPSLMLHFSSSLFHFFKKKKDTKRLHNICTQTKAHREMFRIGIFRVK